MNTDIRISVSFRNHRKRKRLKMMIGEGATDYLLDLWISTVSKPFLDHRGVWRVFVLGEDQAVELGKISGIE